MRRRIRREFTWQSSISDWQLANQINYVYDNNLVIQERTANNLPQVSYTRGNDLSGGREGAGGVGGLLARTYNGLLTIGDWQSHAYYFADALGNITALINTNQQGVATYLYDPFGNIISQAGPLAEANLYRFSSKEWHPNSGVIYYLYRYYAANLQRWLNVDPFLEDGGVNLFRFNYNEPLDRVDTDGLASEVVPGSGGHGNCLSYALGVDDNKDGGIQPTDPSVGIRSWLDTTLKNAGCTETSGSCPGNQKQIDSLTGSDPKSKPPVFHVIKRGCGSKHWGERNGDNGLVVLDPPPIDKQFPGLQKAEVKHYCCPCKSKSK